MTGPAERRITRAVASFELMPSRGADDALAVDAAARAPDTATALGIPVESGDGEVPADVGLDRQTLTMAGFNGSVGQAMATAKRADGPIVFAIGIGDPVELDAAGLRDAAAAFARAAVRHERIATSLAHSGTLEREAAAQAVTEGVLLARYRYRAFVERPAEAVLRELTLTAAEERHESVREGVRRGRVTARAVGIARDLCNTPATHLTARRMADVAVALGQQSGLDVTVYDEQQLLELGCGGLLGVNAGSSEPARLIKLSYTPPAGTSAPHVALVGKGIMYDAGGISLKPSDAMHAAMKLDMSGAAAILGAMITLRDLGCPTRVTGWLTCTDNMPSGTATRLGDVLTMHGGKTVEVVNADAEGRLVMADGLSMAVEEEPDALVTVATLTGAAMRTFGTEMAAMMANRPGLAGQLSAAGSATDELVWELPLVRKYRRKLDSAIADLKNMGGENAGTITAGLFLEDFVDGRPFGHLDICGPMMTDTDDSWRSVGATAFGTRLLAEFAAHFEKPSN